MTNVGIETGQVGVKDRVKARVRIRKESGKLFKFRGLNASMFMIFFFLTRSEFHTDSIF